MARSNKNKSLLEKAVDAVDHVLHPEHAAENKKAAEFSMDEEIGKGLTPAEESSSIESDIQNHPKFAKFIKKGQ